MSAPRLVVCVNERLGPGQRSCAGSGSRELINIFQQRFSQLGLDFEISEQVCLGRCVEGVAMRIAPGGPFFTEVGVADVDDIISALQQFQPAEELPG